MLQEESNHLAKTEGKKKKIIVASSNPVKVEASLEGFKKMFPENQWDIAGVNVPSGVADQPFSDNETLMGAQNRVEAAFASEPEADYWIGIEGGVTPLGNELAAFAWVVVKSGIGSGKARSGTFFLPPAVKELVAQGMELGAADDVVFGKTNSKKKEGAIGLLTGNVVDRKSLYEQAVILALVRFKQAALYHS